MGQLRGPQGNGSHKWGSITRRGDVGSTFWGLCVGPKRARILPEQGQSGLIFVIARF